MDKFIYEFMCAHSMHTDIYTNILQSNKTIFRIRIIEKEMESMRGNILCVIGKNFVQILMNPECHKYQ